jgi:hypothetical protein
LEAAVFLVTYNLKTLKNKTMGGNVDADILTKQHFLQAHMEEKNNWKPV